MIRKIFVLIIFLATSYLCSAKAANVIQDSVKKYKKFYIVEQEGKEPIATRYLFLDPKKIADLSSVSDASNAELSKLLKVDFVITVKFDPGTKLLTLNELLKIYQIKLADWSLPVKVDDEIIDSPQTMLIAQNQVSKVLVKKGKTTAYIQIVRI